MAARKAGFHGDKRGLAILATILASGVALALFLVSFEGLSHVGTLIGLDDVSWLIPDVSWDASWLVPIALDAGIIAMTLLAIIRRAQKRRSAQPWTIVYLLTAGSTAANFASHAERGQGLLPALVAASAPVFLLLISHAIIDTLIESEPAPAKPKRTVATMSAPAVTTTDVAPQAPSAPKPAPAPRTPRAPSARKPASLPFDDVIASTEDGLLADLDRLGADPEVSTKGSAESALLTVTVWALVERHGHSVTDLSRRIGHDTADRLKDRLRKARAQAPELAPALSV